MKEFNLCKHLDESKDTVRKIIKRGDKYIKICKLTKRLHLKKLNRYFFEKAFDSYIAGMTLCAKNIDLLLPIIKKKQSDQKDL